MSASFLVDHDPTDLNSKSLPYKCGQQALCKAMQCAPSAPEGHESVAAATLLSQRVANFAAYVETRTNCIDGETYAATQAARIYLGTRLTDIKACFEEMYDAFWALSSMLNVVGVCPTNNGRIFFNVFGIDFRVDIEKGNIVIHCPGVHFVLFAV
jgi:hypothetical protein